MGRQLFDSPFDWIINTIAGQKRYIALSEGMLAAVYAQLGRMRDAIATARKALEAAEEENRPDLVRALTESLESYETAQ